MRILLIYPSIDRPSPLWMPLGLVFIAAELRRHGHTVAIFDRFTELVKTDFAIRPVNQTMLARINSFQPDIIGLSTLTQKIYDTVDCVRLIRAGFGGMLIAGGYHATAMPELTLGKIPGLDGVITGEGELALSRIANGERPADVPGVWWRNGEHIQSPCAPAEQIENLDMLDQPALDLMDMEFYSQCTNGVIRGHNLRAATLIISRGCYRRCRFCAESVTYGRGVRSHSAAFTLEWIQRVVKDYAVQGIHFHDNNFLAVEARACDICESLMRTGLSRKIRWSIQARSEHINPETVRLLKSAGCCLIEIGVEAGTQHELNRIKKGVTVEMNTNAVTLCRKAGLDVHAYMLMGLEGETISDMGQRLAWIKSARPTSFQWSGVSMYPGTPLYKDKGNAFFERNEWTHASITQYYLDQNLSGITTEERRAWMSRYFSPYARRHWWKDAIRRYPLRNLAMLALSKLRGRIKRICKDAIGGKV